MINVHHIKIIVFLYNDKGKQRKNPFAPPSTVNQRDQRPEYRAQLTKKKTKRKLIVLSL